MGRRASHAPLTRRKTTCFCDTEHLAELLILRASWVLGFWEVWDGQSLPLAAEEGPRVPWQEQLFLDRCDAGLFTLQQASTTAPKAETLSPKPRLDCPSVSAETQSPNTDLEGEKVPPQKKLSKLSIPSCIHVYSGPA